MTTSREFLELVLSGETVTAEHVDALVQHRVQEDVYIEYKPGEFLRDNKRNEELRAYMSGFANVSGGALIIGIEEDKHRAGAITGCDPNDVGGHLAGWASRCIGEMGAFFSPLPRFVEVESTSGARVLVCAVATAFNLVPVISKSKRTYYIRLGDGTYEAPDDLVADLLLGRRARPILEVSDWSVGGIETKPAQYSKCGVGILVKFFLNLEIANSGLVWAEQSRWGIVIRNIDPNTQPIPASHYLGTFVEFASDAVDAAQRLWALGRNVHYSDNVSVDKPFARSWANIIYVTAPLYCDGYIHYRWQAAVYLVAKDAPPIWYQVSLTIDEEFRKHIPVDPDERLPAGGLPRDWPGLSIVRLISERPVVGWTRSQQHLWQGSE